MTAQPSPVAPPPQPPLPAGDRPPFDLESLPDGLRQFYGQFLAYGRTAPARVKEEYRRSAAEGRVRTLFLDARRFNAFARSRGEDHTIALNVAVPCLLHFIFNIVLRLPYVFIDVGDAGAEQRYRRGDDARPLPLELPPVLPVAEALAALPGVSRPRDEGRALVASALTEVATTFCVFHEVGHVVGGHTGCAAGRFWGGDVAEFTGGGGLALCSRRLLGQVWEREADGIAAVMLLSFVVADDGTRQHFRECFGIPDGDGEEDEYAYHVCAVVLFALKLLFLYLAQIPAALNVRGDHPHPLVRAAYVRDVLRLTSVGQLGLDPDVLDPMLEVAADQAAQVWADYGLGVPALKGNAGDLAVAEAVGRQLARLEHAHKQLRPRYARWSWVPESAWGEHEYEGEISVP